MFSLLLLNGGVGKRVGASSPKQFIDINGLPILVYTLVVADSVKDIDQIVINYPPGHKEDVQKIVEKWAIKTPVVFADPGETRHESVANMLELAQNEFVIIHEAARPLVTKEDFLKLINSEYSNVSLMSPISFTVAPVDSQTNKVTGYIERDQLRNVQLPQKFNREDLSKAHQWAKDNHQTFTEDATLVASAGFDTFFIDGTDVNFKITTALDVRLATLLLEQKNRHF
jgi:2-C-methyl-D-erythritol 4-phosphate cytidylyltransferase